MLILKTPYYYGVSIARPSTTVLDLVPIASRGSVLGVQKTTHIA
eukprot:SAG25_NODE_106_length_15358_cov_22.913559_2_plen_44_part_00